MADGTAYSRRGDEFHYRWVAQRSLSLLLPSSTLEYIVVEGDVTEVDGFDSLDATEHYTDGSLRYVQLKHSTVHSTEESNISDYRKTFVDFWKTYSNATERDRISFQIVTNRPWAVRLLENFHKILRGDIASNQTWETLKRYAGEVSCEADLQDFCARLILVGSSADIDEQLAIIRRGISVHYATLADVDIARLLIDMVRQKAQNDDSSRRVIRKTDVLARLGVCGEEDLFPATSKIMQIDNPIEHSDISNILARIDGTSSPFLIHAGAGIGKTVTIQQLAEMVSAPSAVVVFDCFGAGGYRTELGARHTTKKALVQINNELAARDLCPLMILSGNDTADAIVSKLFKNLTFARDRVRQDDPNAQIYIFIDAADNAKEVASEKMPPEDCFIDRILNNDPVEGVHLVVSARTSRKDKLNSLIPFEEYELKPFSCAEVRTFVEAKLGRVDDNVIERLTSFTAGVPRVIAKVLSKANSVEELVGQIAQNVVTVEELLVHERDAAEIRMRREYPLAEAKDFRMLNRMLAILPPDVPWDVISRVIGRPEAFVRDYISEFGYSFWEGKNGVRFKDEPTETWFRAQYGKDGDADALSAVIDGLRPLSDKSIYAARSLPGLLFLAGDYDGLIEFVKSEKTLPINLQHETRRHIMHTRLILAMRALLHIGRFKDAMAMAMKAGMMFQNTDVVAEFIRDHIVLFATQLSPFELESLSIERVLRSGWKGSETLYKSIFLSYIESRKTEADSLCDLAVLLCNEAIIRQSRYKETRDTWAANNENVGRDDVAAIALAILRSKGAGKCVAHLMDVSDNRPFRLAVSRRLSILLSEAGDVESLRLLLHAGQSYPEIAIPIISGLVRCCDSLDEGVIEKIVAMLSVEEDTEFVDRNDMNPANEILTLCQLAFTSGIGHADILKVLDRHYLANKYYDPNPRPPREGSSNKILSRALALREKLSNVQTDVDAIIRKSRMRYQYVKDSEMSQISSRLQDEVSDARKYIDHIVECRLLSTMEKKRRRLENERMKLAEPLKNDEGMDLALDYVRLASAAIGVNNEDAFEYVKLALQSLKTSDVISYWQALQSVADRSIRSNTSKDIVALFSRTAEFTRKKAYRDKYFDRFAFFATIDRFARSANVALFSRWRDNGLEDFNGDFQFFARDFRLLDLPDDVAKACFMPFGGILSDSGYDGPLYKGKPQESAEKYYENHDVTNAKKIISNWAYDGSTCNDIYARVKFMPSEWRTKESVARNITELLLGLTAKFAEQGMDYVSTEWLQLPEILSRPEIVKKMYHELSRYENWTAVDCYRMVMFGQSLLEQDESESLLIEALDDIAEEVDKTILPIKNLEAAFPQVSPRLAFAKLLYAMLGDPDSSDRWRATHVLKNLIVNNANEFLAEIIGVAETGDVEGFICEQHPFYRDTAKTHFLAAIERAANEKTAECMRFIDYLLAVQRNGRQIDHVWFAESALRKLGVCDGVRLKAQVSACGKPTYMTEVKTLARKFEFFVDGAFDEHEVSLLSALFSVKHEHVREMVIATAKKLMTIPTDGHRATDPRWVANDNYEYDQACNQHGAHIPYISFYGLDLCYNALMRVAMDLLCSRPVVSCDGTDSFWKLWVQRHTLSMSDGLWLSDICRRLRGADETVFKSYSDETILEEIPFQFATKGFVVVGACWAANRDIDRYVCAIRSFIVNKNGLARRLLVESSQAVQGIDFVDPLAGGIIFCPQGLEIPHEHDDFVEDYFSSCHEARGYVRAYTTLGHMKSVKIECIKQFLESSQSVLCIEIETTVQSRNGHQDIRRSTINMDSHYFDAPEG